MFSYRAMSHDDPIPDELKRLLDLFTTDLAKLRFGDLDASVLDGAASAVRAAAREVAEAEALADGARASLQAAQDTLMNKSQRALAYARIFAEGLPELRERLAGLALDGPVRQGSPEPTPSPEVAPRRRGRPPRAPAPATGTLALGAGPQASNGTAAADETASP
jgi:hypothetical protein